MRSARRLTALDVRDVRVIAGAAIEPGPELNLVVGPNAAGKTSLLEAVHVLATGRSFAATRVARLVRTGAGPLRVVARVQEGAGGRERRLGLERPAHGSPRMRLDGRTVARVTELARVLPVVAVHPGSHELVGGGPGERRRFLDLGLFHVEPGFHAVWQRYRRAVAQRNALLRGGRGQRELQPWEAEIAAAGTELDRYRRACVADLAPRVERLGHEVLGDVVELEYRGGWSGDAGLDEAVAAARGRDRELLTTSVGPHRADLGLRLGGRGVRQRVSRGQQKMLVYVLRLAQAEQLGAGGGCALLLDDLPAELDRERRAAVLAVAARIGAQVFVSALEAEAVATPADVGRKVFHVEQGVVSEVVQ